MTTQQIIAGNWRESFEHNDLKSPFPWFGGKSRAAPMIWEAMGKVVNYVEPFFGSGAVLLGRPHAPTIETVNDMEGHLVNFWRSIAQYPDAVADAADWPVMEADLHARHKYLTALRGKLSERLMTDPLYCNPTIAAWWVWGICTWIGGGWCSEARAASRQSPKLGGGTRKSSMVNHGMGIHSSGMRRQLPDVGGGGGCAGGIGTKLGRGVNHSETRSRMPEVFEQLSLRLRYTRVTCGDFERILSPAVTWKHGLTGVVLDPPYLGKTGRAEKLYASDDLAVAHRAREWAIANGDNRLLRIALCGYEGEHDMPAFWRKVEWKAQGGYGSQRRDGTNDNAAKERIWFSPHCLQAAQGNLFGGAM